MIILLTYEVRSFIEIIRIVHYFWMLIWIMHKRFEWLQPIQIQDMCYKPYDIVHTICSI